MILENKYNEIREQNSNTMCKIMIFDKPELKAHWNQYTQLYKKAPNTKIYWTKYWVDYSCIHTYVDNKILNILILIRVWYKYFLEFRFYEFFNIHLESGLVNLKPNSFELIVLSDSVWFRFILSCQAQFSFWILFFFCPLLIEPTFYDNTIFFTDITNFSMISPIDKWWLIRMGLYRLFCAQSISVLGLTD